MEFQEQQPISDAEIDDLLAPAAEVTPPEPRDNAAVALDLARRGFLVFPIILRADGEWTPITGFQPRATSDPGVVSAWWRNYPRARVGLLVGERAGLTALDIDRKGGKDGFASLRALGFDPDAMSPVMVRTPSGGRHAFYRYDPDCGDSIGAIGVGLDTKGHANGSYVVAPGSFKDTGRYEPLGAPLGSVPLPAFPATLRPPRKPERPAVEPLREATDEQRDWAAEYLAHLAADLAETTEGYREKTYNDAAFWAGGAAAHGFITKGQAEAALKPAALACGLRHGEVVAKFKPRGAWTQGLASPIADYPGKPLDDSELDDLDDLEERPDAPDDFDRLLGLAPDDDLAVLDCEPAPDLDPEAAPTDAPAPVDLWGHLDPVPLPAGVLPAVIDAYAAGEAETVGCDPAGAAMAALAACAGAIPDHVRLKMRRHSDWFVQPRLWVALVGAPSAKKTPTFDAAVAPLHPIERDLAATFGRRHAAWKALDKDEQKATLAPIPERLLISDATCEAAQHALRGSPKGMICLRDELSGWFSAMERPGAVSERSFWLQAFNGGWYRVDRVDVSRNYAIENIGCSILGGIQPDVIRRIADGGADDGLLQRFLPVVLRAPKMGADVPRPSSRAPYHDAVTGLRALGPVDLTFDAGAREIFERFERDMFEMRGVELVNRKLASHLDKLLGIFGRLCIVWHCLQPVDLMDPCLATVVSADTASRVDRFVREFIIPHSAAFYAGVLDLSPDQERMQALVGYVLARGLKEVTARELQASVRSMRGLKAQEVEPIFEQLAALGWLIRIPPLKPGARHRWKVNPAAHDLFAGRAAAEEERRALAREALTKHFAKGRGEMA